MFRNNHVCMRAFCTLGLFFALTQLALAVEPLHIRIDRMIEADQIGPLSLTASDADFLRRVYLDLTGVIPSTAVARAFINDPTPDKRERLIEQLLDSPAYVRHMTTTFDLMLMERRPDKLVPSPQWQQYLYDSLAQNKPYDQLVREILSADGSDPNMRAPAKFFLDRDVEPNLLTRDIGRIFFGRDLQCAQCHDHPIVDGYLQNEYHGLYAFLSRSSLFTDKEQKTSIADKAEGDITYESVFTGRKANTRPHLPGGLEVAEPSIPPGEEYTVAPADGVRPVPKHSRRLLLAQEATNGTNRAFNRNIVNRLWAHMMGRGLVHPLDFHHADNPASHPELLELLADEFVATKYDIRALLKQLALTRTYQRGVEISPAALASEPNIADQIAATTAAQESSKQALIAASDAVDKIDEQLEVAEKTLIPLYDELAKTYPAVSAAKTAAVTASQALSSTQTQLATKEKSAALLADALAKIQAALSKIPGDSDLTSAAALFQARATASATEIATLKSTSETQAAAATTAQNAFKAAQQASLDARAKLVAASAPVEALRAQFQAATVEMDRHAIAAKHHAQANGALKDLAAYSTSAAVAEQSQATVQKLNSDLELARASLANLSTELTNKQSLLASAQSASQAATQALAEAQAQTNSKREAAMALADAAASSELARQGLPEDAELAKIVEQLKAKADLAVNERTNLDNRFAELQNAVAATTQQLTAAQASVELTSAQIAATQQSVTALESQIPAAAEKATADAAAKDTAFLAVAEHQTSRFATANLRPLSPEQICWSIMQATDVMRPVYMTAEAEMNASNPLSEEAKKDLAQLAQRARQIEQAAFEKLRGNFPQFVQIFGASSGQSQDTFFATVDQALFFNNGGQVQSWLTPAGDNLASRLLKIENPAALSEELYLSVLTRTPTAEETADIAQYMQSRGTERPAAVAELIWALLTSNEFRFNH